MTETESLDTSSPVRQRSVVMQSGQSPADALAMVESDAALLADAASKGAVWLRRRRPNGQMAKLSRLRDLQSEVLDGSELFANLNPCVLASTVEAPTLIEQHKNYSFWFKPRGVLSQGSKWGDHTSMPFLVQSESSQPTHLVHRLDRHACGLMVVAHTRPAVRELTALFARRRVFKRYQVCVQGAWAHPVPFECQDRLDDKKALTEIESLEDGFPDETSGLRIRLHTGRKHQIRRHLAGAGHPVLGDRRYGDPESTVPLALMSTEIHFDCPFTDRAINCCLPDEWRKTLIET